jgi:protein-arginine deiminase
VPHGADNFGVSGSSEVEVFLVYHPSQVTKPASKAHWPLNTNMDVVVSVSTASKDLNDLKVRTASSE